MTIHEKVAHFIAGITDVFRDEEDRELAAFSKLELNRDATEDITAILIAFQYVVQRLTGFEGDLIDFTHILNKLAFQYLMENGKEQAE